VKAVTIDARHEYGDVQFSEEKVLETLELCKENNEVPIVHTVWGSKTGIVEKINDKVSSLVSGLGGLMVVDAC